MSTSRQGTDNWNKEGLEELIKKVLEGGPKLDKNVSNTLVSLKNLCFLLVDKVSFLKDEIECLKRDNRNEELRMDGLNKTIADQKRALNDMKKQREESLNKLKKELGEMKEEKEKMIKELEQNKTLVKDLARLEKEKDIWEKELNDLKNENERLRKDIKELSLSQDKQEERVNEVANNQLEFSQNMVKDKEETLKWIDVVRKGGVTHKKELISDTIEEDKRREYKSLNIIVRGLETKGSPKDDAAGLFQKLGVSLDLEAAWRVGKEDTREKPLIIRFKAMEGKMALLKKRVLLKGSKIYLDEDLTHLQLENRREGLIKVMAARKGGKWAVFRDGRVLVRERRNA